MTRGWEQEAFLKGALADLQILRSLGLSPKEAFSADEFAEAVGGFAVESGADFEAKRDQSTESLVGFLREKSAPPHYLYELLTYRNVLGEAISLHFGRAIESDKELFRHYAESSERWRSWSPASLT